MALVLRAAERRAVPWKNGGGVTREVFVQPPGSAFEAFDWRMSIAEVHKAGPFSAFPGVERHMAILAGRLELSMEERRVTLSSDSAPLVFPGELPVHATPRGEAVTDLNLMVRRARCAARLVPGTVSQSQPLAGNVGTRLILALGKLTLQVAGEDALELAALDAAVLEPGCGCELASGAQGTVTRFYCGEITSVANRDA